MFRHDDTRKRAVLQGFEYVRHRHRYLACFRGIVLGEERCLKTAEGCLGLLARFTIWVCH